MSFLSKLLLVLVATSICLLSVGNLFVCGFAEVSPSQQQQQQRRWQRKNNPKTTGLYETSVGTGSSSNEELDMSRPGNTSVGASLKLDLLQLAASYDRGYGATKRAGEQAESLISQLEAINPEQNAVWGIEGDDDSPLTGSWRMVWTTASAKCTRWLVRPSKSR
mmetsp:Transcript_61859/g.71083  ORF Transcript_61859/g.71083 Transcript_61859/m.71083 type:complete len:164 (-) Transcript_61859:97-588(-)|eukprot:CAMPEP_0170801156 /NCGR_PEP_ID=MMETSP0733-20121128/28350_1 /TAXON_ID=186038 /ORGANISM="Fragilariopsis kerguelensis, Strain L26-C5" /LENGTH=163 /DNA_ID=CAMNT_0011153779 /DNA_START=863 /DNA_END=1354 /DNA_ORIENTATION=-